MDDSANLLVDMVYSALNLSKLGSGGLVLREIGRNEDAGGGVGFGAVMVEEAASEAVLWARLPGDLC